MKQKLFASVVALFFAIPFGAVGLGAAYAIAAMVYDGMRARDWVLVKADVTGTESYRYTIGGKTYDGSRLGTLRLGGSSSVDDFEERVAGMLVTAREQKKPLTVFVNPDEPAEAMVDRDIRWGLLLFLTPFAVAFGGIGLGALWLVRRIFTQPGAPVAANAGSGAGGLWFFALVWNAISLPMAALVIPEAVADGDWAVLFVLIFPLIGVLVLWAAIVTTVERARRGGAGKVHPQMNEQRRSA